MRGVCVLLVRGVTLTAPFMDAKSKPSCYLNPPHNLFSRVSTPSGDVIRTRVKQELATVMEKNSASMYCDGVVINPNDAVRVYNSRNCIYTRIIYGACKIIYLHE